MINLNISAVVENLKVLRELGIVNYESASTEEAGFAVYNWKKGKKPQDIQYIPRLGILTKKVDRFLVEKGEGNCDEIVRIVGKGHNRPAISHILAELCSQGVVEAKFQGRKIMSQASLTDNSKEARKEPVGREVRKELVKKIKYALQDRSELDFMEKIHQQFVNDFEMLNEYAGKADDLYKTASPWANTREIQETRNIILSFIEKYE